MTLQELKESDWYISRPDIIKEAINLLPPICLYKFKDSGKQCFIYSYEEPESNKVEDVTVTVQKTGVGGSLAEMGLGKIDTNQVFGVKLQDLIKWEDDKEI